jgi:hypothetical protein
LQDWILIENNKVVQGKGKKKTVTFHWNTWFRDSKNTSKPKTSGLSFNGQPLGSRWWFDNRYSQRGVQWAVKQVAKAAGIIKVPPIPCDTLMPHLLEDGMDIMTLKDLWDIKMLRLQWNTCILPNSRVSAFLVHSIRFCTMQSGSRCTAK